MLTTPYNQSFQFSPLNKRHQAKPNLADPTRIAQGTYCDKRLQNDSCPLHSSRVFLMTTTTVLVCNPAIFFWNDLCTYKCPYWISPRNLLYMLLGEHGSKGPALPPHQSTDLYCILLLSLPKSTFSKHKMAKKNGYTIYK